MSGRRNQTLAPSLFPFLAVLVCTLGTLILLLALLAENSATAAEQRAREQALEKLGQIEPRADRPTAERAQILMEEAQFHIDTIESTRDQQAAELERRRDELTHLEDHIRRLTQQLQRLSTEIDHATDNVDSESIDRSMIQQLQNQIDTEKQAIEQLKQDTDRRTPRVVIVPHKGPNGTTRRPIYVECTAAGLTIWPEGVQIPTAQLEGRYSRQSNPLDAALRVARLHVMKVYGDSDPPYPLMVVRPDGTDAYHQAIVAMDDWDDQYGYEMLDTGIELAVGTADPNLKRRMEAAIAQAMQQRADRRTVRAVPLRASDLARRGRAMGFHERPNHPYHGGAGPENITGGPPESQLDDIYRQAAQELRERDNHDLGTDRGDDENGPHGAIDSARSGETNNDSGSTGTQQSQSGGSETRSSSNTAPRASGGPSSPMQAAQSSGNSDQQAEPQTPQATNQSAATVHRDGQDWALPENVRRSSGIAIIRSIRVQLHRDRFVLPASRGAAAKVIPFNGDLDRASLQLATALRDRIDRWGVALDNGRWQPRLEFEVLDGSSRQIDQLQRLFRNSGIEVIHRELR